MKLRHLGLLLGAFVVGAGGLLGEDLWTASRGLNAVPPRPTFSEYHVGGRGQRLIFAGGTVEGTQRDISMRFEMTGRIETVHVREGDIVEKGDVLAELDSQSWQQRVAEAAARLKLAQGERERLVNGARPETREVLKADARTAEVHVNEAEAIFSRAKQLVQRNSLSAQELDDNRFKYEKAVAALQAVRAKLAEIEAPARVDELDITDARIALAEATLRHERTMLDRTRLRAPIDGVILHILVEPGELVGPEDVRSLITITNRDRTRVRAFVEELDSLAVSPGQTAHVTVDGKPDRQYNGQVLSCSPFVRGKSQRHHRPGELIDVKVREIVIELQDADDLVVGLPVDAFIHPGEYH